MNAVTPIRADGNEIIEAVIAKGDLARLDPDERATYYVRVCESVGLNPMTRPFEFITLNGKLVLYARKDCTDQLRTLHKVSVVDLTDSEREGVFIVTAKVQNADGRTDAAKGAVTITGLKGEALANALMKAETKAKRRATLSICGLGFLDEIEVEDIPTSAKERKEQTPKTTLPKKDARDIYTKLQAELDAETTCKGLNEWGEAVKGRVATLPEDWQGILRLRYEEKMLDLRQRETKLVNDNAPDHDADGVIWDEHGERPATTADVPDDGIPANLRRMRPTMKDQMLAEIPELASAQDCLHWGLQMSDVFDTLNKKDKETVRHALMARQAMLVNGSIHA